LWTSWVVFVSLFVLGAELFLASAMVAAVVLAANGLAGLF
jgi:hypothetical protein